MTGAAVRGLRNPFKVQKGTVIKHGDGHLFLPGTKGRTVAITYVESKGEKVAQSIEVKAQKP